jgi:hypothetical protein
MAASSPSGMKRMVLSERSLITGAPLYCLSLAASGLGIDTAAVDQRMMVPTRR